MAAYVGILDGHTLWLAVQATPGTLALRDAAGQGHPLVSDLPEDDPAYRPARAALATILDGTPGEGGGFDVVVVPTNGRPPQQVWVPPFPSRPTRVPPGPDGHWQLTVLRTQAGMLRIRRRRPAPGAEVVALDVDADGIRVTVGPTDATSVDLVEPGDEGGVVASFTLTREGDRAAAVLTAAGLPASATAPLRLQVGGVPLRRRANDLVNPHAAVLLPVLVEEETGRDLLQMRWSPDAALVARLVADDEPDEDDDGDDDPESDDDAADEDPT